MAAEKDLKYIMRPVWLEINLDHLAYNLRLLREAAGGAQIIGVIKADAYGHGAAGVAHELVRLGVWGLAVATVEEGRHLRRSGIEAPVVLLGSHHPDQSPEVLAAGVIPTLSTLEAAAALNRAARVWGVVAEAHLKFDTGMGRIGFQAGEALAIKQRMREFPHVRVSGIYSHFASAEDDPDWTERQIAEFAVVRGVFGPGYLYHTSNTAAIFRAPHAAHDAVRPGIGLYGLLPGYGLRPVARLVAKPALVKCVPAGRRIGYGGVYTTAGEEWIATLPIGYADGMPRSLAGRATVRLLPCGGQPPVACPVVGMISMDQITVRLPGPVGLEQEFEVVSADFDPTSSLWGWAEQTGTISYEQAVRLSARLPRVYVRGGVEVSRSEYQPPVESDVRVGSSR